MSENLTNSRIIKDKPRSKKLNPKIDLSAMVSVSFLLIIFFMVNAEMSKPQKMNLSLPNYDNYDDGVIYCGVFPARVITLLLDDNNRIISYKGWIGMLNESPKKLSYGKEGIRKELIEMNFEVLKATKDRKRGTIVIIKPSKKSTYGNLVDILDEVAITNIETFTIQNDFTPEEYRLLASR